MLKEVFEFWGKTFVERLRDSHLKAGQKATGKTLQEFKYEAEPFKLTVTGADHIEYLDRGRGGGGIPQGFRFMIYNWMAAKGIFQNETEQAKRSIAYFIAKKIQREGTFQHRTGKTFSGAERPVSNVFAGDVWLRMMLNQIEKKLGEDFKYQIDSIFAQIKQK